MFQTVDKVMIMGAGALGMLLGGYLQIGGKSRVSLVGHNPYMRAIRENGLKIKFPDGSQMIIQMDAYTSVDQVSSKPDWIVLTVRAYQTIDAMQQIVSSFGKSVPVVTFQNGMTINDMQSYIGENAIGGETLISAKIVSPGFVESPQNTGLYIGEMSSQVTQRVNRMCDAFNAVRDVKNCMEAFVTNNIFGAIWAKLLINATNNVLSAVTDLSVRQIYENEKAQRYAFGLVTEVLEVAKIEGADIYNTPVSLAKAFMDNSKDINIWRTYLLGRAPTLSHFKLSMSDMLGRGIKTEVDQINGYVVLRAHAHGIRVPHHEGVVNVIHGIERGEIKQSLDSLPDIP